MLAALGGSPAVPTGLHHPYPPVGQSERQWIEKALSSGRLWGPWGPLTRLLEEQWALRVGVRHCAAVNSGTAALHCAVVGCGVLPGDEVIVPAYTFIGSVSGVMTAGGIPVFADVEPDTGHLCVSSLKEHITDRTRAILVVHLHGLPADLTAILAEAVPRGIAIIEDCAQAHGAMHHGRPVGGIGDVGAFSLNATKLLAGPEGGLLTTNRQDVFNRAARLRVFGMEYRDSRSVVRSVDGPGYSYRTNELMSAFALARLEAFDSERLTRKRNARRLSNGLSGLPGVHVPPEPDGREHLYQAFRVRLTPLEAGVGWSAAEFRARVVAALIAEGARWWTWETRALPEYAIFQTKNAAGGGLPWTATTAGHNITYQPERTPNAIAIARDALFTSSHFPPNDDALIDAYITAFHKVWDHLKDLSRIRFESVAEDELFDFT